MGMYLYAWIPNLMVGWLVALALAVVGYLLTLKIREIRRNRIMDEQRERLGLRRVYGSIGSWLH
jgi:hypothetical protein